MKAYSYEYWTDELQASYKMLREFHNKGSKIVERFVDYRKNDSEYKPDKLFRLNLFNSNVTTLIDMLYGQLPKAEADRTYADSNDDVARVAANMLERVLNLDIANHPQHYDSMLRSSLQDRLLSGLGVAKVRYEAEFRQIEAVLDADGFEIEAERTELVSEDSPIDYFHWQDVCWGWSRNWDQIPWIAFASYLTKDEAAKRFGKDIADKLDYKKQKVSEAEDVTTSDDLASPKQKAKIQEIWCKKSGKVYWYSSGAKKLLDEKKDPLQLRDFYPCPQFMVANTTTSLYVPTADYHLCQDLYNEIDELQTRISLLTKASKVVGVYEGGNDEVKRMLQDGVENQLIPVDNWAMLGDKGGLKGVIDWLPLNDITAALDKLRQVRDETIGLLQQISGMSDIMRGSLGNQYEGVGQSQLKAQFGSVRVQSLSEQFADFAGQAMNLKAEIICRHYEPQTIVQLSNMEYSYDREYLPSAVQLLKNPESARIRIKVRPETVAIQDFASLKADRTEFLNGMATFMQSAAPMLQQEPNAMPYLLKMLQWAMSGFKGSSEIESVLDKAVEGAMAQQKNQQGKPDPEQQKAQAEMGKIQAKLQADMQLRQQDLQADMQTALASHKAKMAEIEATHVSRMREIQAKSQADMMKEQTQMQANVTQTQSGAAAEMAKDAQQAEYDREQALLEAEIQFAEELEKSINKIRELAVQSETKINEMVTNAALTEKDDDAELDSD